MLKHGAMLKLWPWYDNKTRRDADKERHDAKVQREADRKARHDDVYRKAWPKTPKKVWSDTKVVRPKTRERAILQ